MAGLSVLLETNKNNSRKPRIISKATLHNRRISSSSPATTTVATSSFLQRCFLCGKELAEGKDIYMYRGDRAFCSVECRHRQIFMDEDTGSNHCAKGAAAVRASRRAATGGGFAY